MDTTAGHVSVGEAAGKTVELLVVVGPEASGIVEGARAAGLDAARIHHVEDVEGALDVLRPRLRDGDTILVKASRGIGLDRVVDALRLELGERSTMTVELIQGLLLAFALVVILMPPYIRLLQALGFGKRIREEGPETHYVKEGTPTMGGLLIVLVVLGIFLFLREPGPDTFAPLAALAGVGLLGAFDDYLNARTGEGIRARQKLIWLTVVAFVAAWQIQRDLRDHGHRGAVRRRRPDRAVAVRPVRGVRDHRRLERGEPHRRARRPVRRHGGHRLRRVPAHRAPQPARRRPTLPCCAP